MNQKKMEDAARSMNLLHWIDAISKADAGNVSSLADRLRSDPIQLEVAHHLRDYLNRTTFTLPNLRKVTKLERMELKTALTLWNRTTYPRIRASLMGLLLSIDDAHRLADALCRFSLAMQNERSVLPSHLLPEDAKCRNPALEKFRDKLSTLRNRETTTRSRLPPTSTKSARESSPMPSTVLSQEAADKPAL